MMKKIIPKQHRYKLLIFILLVLLALGNRTYYYFVSPYTDNTLEVHCLDVGQGDSTLIAGSSQIMLIDAAEQEYADEITQYLTEQGVKKIDVLVATHPHDDHIGGMSDVIEQFDIGCLVMTDEFATTIAYQEMLLAAQKQKIPIVIPQVGDTLPFHDAQCTVLGPITMDEENSNNNSLILRMKYGNNHLLFTGDAETKEEREVIASGVTLSSDFLHASHHGSKTSSSDEFLAHVAPSCIVISAGVGNQFGHPASETLVRMKEWSNQIFRTDLEGTIVIFSDGTQLYRKMVQ